VLVLQSELAEAIARELRVATHPKTHASRSAEALPESRLGSFIWESFIFAGRHAELSRSLIVSRRHRNRIGGQSSRTSTFALGWAGLAGVYGFSPTTATRRSSQRWTLRG